MKQQVINNKRTAGFTLIELLVVLVILGLLAGLVGPNVMKYVGSSKVEVAKAQLEDLAAGLDLFKLDVGRYPTIRFPAGTAPIYARNAYRWTRGTTSISTRFPARATISTCSRSAPTAKRKAPARTPT
jgi:prepilin-type N-terminal cleavage/methylation domain-containing protein